MGITQKNMKDRVTCVKETVIDCDLKLNDTKKMHSSCVVNFELKPVKDLRKSERCFPNDIFYFFCYRPTCYGYCQCECRSDVCICLINACNSASEDEV
jgi:hypothetical protein